MAAVRNPVAAAALEAEFPFQRLLAALITFVARAQLALPSILKVSGAAGHAALGMLLAALSSSRIAWRGSPS